jgi:hypothetical protein
MAMVECAAPMDIQRARIDSGPECDVDRRLIQQHSAAIKRGRARLFRSLTGKAYQGDFGMTVANH